MTYFPTTSFSNPSSFSKPPVQHQLVSARMEVQGLSPVTADGSLVLDKDFADIRVRLDAEARTFWCRLTPQGRPCVSPGVLRDLTEMQADVARWLAQAGDEKRPFDYFVVASGIPGIFNMGGDLKLFAEAVRKEQRVLLQHYAHRCIDVVYNNLVSYSAPVVTIALVQGDALGGGFETALSCNLIAAERGTKFGLPEVLFNLFPGMGAYSLIARRIGAVQAERMILSGRIYTAEELHELGLVDMLLTPGQGDEELRQYIAGQGRRHNAMQAVFRARHIAAPVTLKELRDIVDVWVDAAMRLSPADLRKMERLAAAQERRTSRDRGIGIAAE
ncbi:crotonase/enoyl-CoA hydratase family protein [Roseomonas gilardii]|uniref:crotonase/enoyl-CoA hydratase family protein n=1 Tax=Roseomonas gilardii TaxID=257708 RepID=UPI0011A5565D|nr:crotonase/enoyl-CoA hydratase family protein [Roseomonas gilardii]